MFRGSCFTKSIPLYSGKYKRLKDVVDLKNKVDDAFYIIDKKEEENGNT